MELISKKRIKESAKNATCSSEGNKFPPHVRQYWEHFFNSYNAIRKIELLSKSVENQEFIVMKG